MKNSSFMKSSVLLSLCSALFLNSCASLSGEPSKAKIAINKNVSISNSKVLVMPVISMTNKTFNSPLLDANFALIWANNIGKENVIPLPYAVLKEIPFSLESINIIAKNMIAEDKKESIVKLKGTPAEKFLKTISEKYGDYSIAFATVSTDEESYAFLKEFNSHMGLLNLKTLTWKWSSENEFKKGMISLPFNAAVQKVTSSAMSDIKKQNQEKLL
ncbi:hypothetical protein [Fluviispira vulneris]|uniref:hypothetical protein n=1 Tax=Fluviispira vulneris TaxID=2763012 RepID=UPI001645E6D2|nr:hypothetical protein [Fluviispira vulneris]